MDHRYRQQQGAGRPGQLECSFCSKAQNRNDDFRFTHLLRDRQGNPSCPFLKVFTCLRCYKKGHTSTHCTDPDTEPNLLAAELELLSTRDRCVDDEQALQRKLYELDLEMRIMLFRFRKSDYHTPKECTFCKNGNYRDSYYKTHTLSSCPRLACTRCPRCRNNGHTMRYCPLSAPSPSDEPLVEESSLLGTFILDFEDPMEQDDASSPQTMQGTDTS